VSFRSRSTPLSPFSGQVGEEPRSAGRSGRTTGNESKDKVLGRNTAGAAIAAPVRHRRIASAPPRVLGVFIALMILGLTASSALATTGHIYSGQFGGSGNDPGAFTAGGPTGLVVRQSTGDVFVGDGGHNTGAPDFLPAPRIERFDASGVYQASFGIDAAAYAGFSSLAIDPAGAASVYAGAFDNALQTGAVLKYSAAGVFAYALTPNAGTAFTWPVSVAVDPGNGTVYVNANDTTSGAALVESFSNTGTYLASFDGSNGHAAFAGVSGLSVDAANRVYVLDSGTVLRYSAAGAFQLTVDDGSRGAPVAVTADPVNSQVYVVEAGLNGQQVTQLTAGGGNLVNTFGTGRITGAQALGVKSTTGTVYVADPGSTFVERFTTFVGPTPTTTAAASIDPNNETLNGTVNPNSIATTYHFEYGLDKNYGSSTAETSAGSGAVAVPATAVTDPAAPLAPNTLYHVRLVASNASGTIVGDDVTFTTALAAPTVDNGPTYASEIASDAAILNGTVNPQGSATTFHFDYGTAAGVYTSVTPDDTSVGSAVGDLPVSAPLTGLTPGTTYYYRVSASNGTGGTITGAEQSFSTAPGDDAFGSAVTAISATLNGVINPHGNGSQYHFEYGTTTAYGKSTLPTYTGTGTVDKPVSLGVTGLSPGTTYHVRVVSQDPNGLNTYGDDGTFTTDPAPAATTGGVTGLGTDRATFSGTFDTHGLSGTYQFIVASSTSAYVSRTAPVTVSGTGTASGTLTDLPAGGDYTVRLAVSSSGATTFGDEVTFQTAAAPPVQPPPPSTTVSNPYGCAAPVLAAYNQRPKPGDTITISGTDLGVGGSVALGSSLVNGSSWSATGFSIVLPDDATGTLPLTVNCGTLSNTIAIAMYKAPSNSFTATGKVSGSSATLSVKVPGAGAITVTGGSVKKASKHASKSGTSSVKVSLSAAGKKSLKRHKKLSVSLTVRFTPTGGSTASKTVKVTFKQR
jgi:hypothetical protein